jgi:hypothetical protein
MHDCPASKGSLAPSDAAKNGAQSNPWRPRLITNKVYGMDTSKENKENRDANQDIADSEKPRLVPADLDIPDGNEEKHEESICHRRCLPRFELSGWDVAAETQALNEAATCSW